MADGTEFLTRITEIGPILLDVVVLSIILERSAAILFEWSVWQKLKDKYPDVVTNSPVAFLLALLICSSLNFDILKIFSGEDFKVLEDGKVVIDPSLSIGIFLAAGVIAGGSKGAIKLFQGILGFGKDAVNLSIQNKTQGSKNPKTDSFSQSPD